MTMDTNVDAASSSSETPPRTALRWIIQNAITSDTELAILSNVCTQWRLWLTECLLEGATTSDDEADTCQDDNSFAWRASRKLLLPSMIRNYTTQQQQTTNRREHNNAICESKDPFCVAWFAPEGIQQLSWAQMIREDEILEKLILEAQDSAASRDLTQELDTNHSEASQDDERHHNSSRPMIMTPQTPLAYQAAAQQQATASRQTFQWQRKGRGVVLTNEWRGYREPIQVLRPFGYTRDFVDAIFVHLAKDPSTNTNHVNGDALLRAEDKDCQAEYAQPSYAVRGVTVARPESFCLCIDQVGEMSTTTTSNGVNDRKRLQRLRDRKDLRRTVFPRVLTKEGTPPFVQFLNVDKSSAVTLITPALACGVLREPFTIFLVGIATEDGCFLSGLRRRFEIGHLYPRDQLADITDSSAVCLFTEDWSPEDEAREKESMEDDDGNDDDESMGEDDSVDSWDEDVLKDNVGCSCIFQGMTEKLSVLEDEDERNGRLVRGVLGPGAWHCYTMVVDGVDSLIRVDGVAEPMEVHQKSNTPAFLDGLTLGSDHCFGTSLCCGQGSPGEGEGAMAEVAVFHGRMDPRDMDTLEKHLMKRHGIPLPGLNPWREDDLYRQARAMFQLVGNPRGTRVPLRYFAKSPNVAWKLIHPVSNQDIKRDRIGARNDESSSDW